MTKPHEYKVMGMAPYASEYEIEKAYNVLAEVLKVENLDIVNKTQDCTSIFGSNFMVVALTEYPAVQNDRRPAFPMVSKMHRTTGLRNIVFPGGVAQNIKAIKYL